METKGSLQRHCMNRERKREERKVFISDKWEINKGGQKIEERDFDKIHFIL